MKKLIVVLLLFAVVFAGCGKKANNTTEQDDSTVQKVLVGTEGTYKPFNYMDEDGNLIGYDIDVLKEVDRRIEELEFDFIAVQWDSLFLGLETGKYDMVADQIVRTPERDEKYLFCDNSYFKTKTYIVVREEEDSINSLDDLKGKNIGVSVGTTFATILENYNAENDNAINITYFEGNATSIFQDLDAGRLDAAMNDLLILNDAVETLGLKIKTTGDPVDESAAYHVFQKGEEGEALRDKVDEALEEMIADGTLSDISIKWFGEDLSQ